MQAAASLVGYSGTQLGLAINVLADALYGGGRWFPNVQRGSTEAIEKRSYRGRSSDPNLCDPCVPTAADLTGVHPIGQAGPEHESGRWWGDGFTNKRSLSRSTPWPRARSFSPIDVTSPAITTLRLQLQCCLQLSEVRAALERQADKLLSTGTDCQCPRGIRELALSPLKASITSASLVAAAGNTLPAKAGRSGTLCESVAGGPSPAPAPPAASRMALQFSVQHKCLSGREALRNQAAPDRRKTLRQPLRFGAAWLHLAITVQIRMLVRNHSRSARQWFSGGCARRGRVD
jgi:hypothetical protein